MSKNNMAVALITLIVVIVAGYFFIIRGANNVVVEEEHHVDGNVEEYEIYPGDVVEKIENNENIILLDVRMPSEYEAVHLRGAVLLPVQELSGQSLASIGLGEDSKDKEIIIYCRSGSRSKTAYDIMKSLGYTNIKSVSGGMIHWEEDNYPFTEAGEYDSSVEVSNNEGNDTVSDRPHLVLDSKFHDFGVIPQYGGTVEKDFIIKNTVTETLSIGDITTSCSCTSTKITKQEIKAGGEAVLTVVFDPDFHEEPLDVFKRTIFIPTNDSSSKEAEITIQVDIAEGE
jgi:rhodanese-related sulfurtransferase